jgi:CheY-like chemotaxis protein
MKHVKNVFVVDDDQVTTFVTERLLKQFDKDCKITSFNDPQEALEVLYKIKNNNSSPLPEVVLLDINMPGLNGFEFLEKMRSEGLDKDVQVVMYTSSDRVEDKSKSNAYDNVIGYMEKPFSAQVFGKILDGFPY